ncbi:MAG: CHAT domain-containing tetratricopeptide repeat protein [Pseudomonadota bacterium]
MIWVDTLPVKSEIAIFEGNQLVHRQALPTERGLGGVFQIPPSSKATSLRVMGRSLFNTEVEFSAEVSTERVSHPEDTELYRELHSTLSSWQEKSDTQWPEVASRLWDILQNPGLDQTTRHRLLPVYGGMLLEHEDYERAAAIVTQHFEKLPGYKSEVNRRLAAVAVPTYRNLNQFEAGIEVAKKLLLEMEQETNLSVQEQLDLIAISGELGLLMIMQDAFKISGGGMQAASEVLISAISKAEALGDLRLAAVLYNYLSPYHFLNGRKAEAEVVLRKSINLHRGANSQRLLVNALNNLAQLFHSNERVEEAIAPLLEAIAIERQFPSSTSIYAHESHLGNVFMDVGDPRMGELYLRSALNGFNKTGNEFYSMIARRDLARSLVEQQKYEEAIESLELALDYFVKNEYPIYAFRASVSLAHTLLKTGARDRERLASLLKNISEYERDIFRSDKELIDRELLFVESSIFEGSADKAERHLLSVQELLENADQASFRDERIESFKLQIKLGSKTNDLARVEQAAQEAYRIVENVRVNLAGSVLGAKWSDKVSSVVDLHVEALFSAWLRSSEDSLLEKIFNLTEKNQAYSFRLSLAKWRSFEQVQNYATSIPDQRTKENELSAVNAISNSAKSESQRKARESTLASMGSDDGRALRPIMTLTFEEIQTQLADDELVLRFWVREHSSFVLAVTSDSINSFSLPESKDLHALALSFVNELSSRGGNTLKAQAQLSSMLSIPTAIFKNKNRLIYLPDGPLEYLPLELISPSGLKQKRLLDTLQVVKIPSLSEYFTEQPKAGDNVDWLNDVAVFADPVFDMSSLVEEKSPPVSGDLFRSWTTNLARLPGTAREASTIKKTFPERPVFESIADSATNQAFLSQDFRFSKLIHIATHGYFNPSTPNIVGIASTFEEGSPQNNGFLSLSDIRNNFFPANLIVISGCETILGESLRGEGLMSMSQGMLMSGAGSVIATLWPIPDSSTSIFMELFYTELSKNGGFANKALNSAKLQMQQNPRFRHPFHWASFVFTAAHQSSLQPIF